MSTNKKGHTHDISKSNSKSNSAKGSKNSKNPKKKSSSNYRGKQTPKVNTKPETKAKEKVATVEKVMPVAKETSRVEKNITVVKRTENINLGKIEEPKVETKTIEESATKTTPKEVSEKIIDTMKPVTKNELPETKEEVASTPEMAPEKDTTERITAVIKEESEKHDNRPSRIDLKNKSEGFKLIIDAALAYEKLESENTKLSSKNKELIDEKKKLVAETNNLKFLLDEGNKICEQKQEEITNLKAEIEQRNEVIGIVKADKSESEQEFKNALAASLKTFYVDFNELKAMPMDGDVGAAITETFDNFIKVLEKNGISMK